MGRDSVEDIQLAILTARGVNGHLRRWGQRFPHVWLCRGSDSREGIPEARNAIFRRFRDDCGLPWLLMMDDDSVPVAQSEPLLDCREDIAGPHVVARTGREAHAHCLSAACVKISRRAVVEIRDPWFRYSRRPRGCECSWFFHRAYRAGFRPVHVGVIGHRFPVVVLPGPVFKFDSEIRSMLQSAARDEHGEV